MMLQKYFDRIGYSGIVEPNLDTLAALLESHVCSVPFENLDVQLSRPLSIHIEEAYEKIVVNSRGGWCYQQNGLLGWALSEIGFDVTRIAAAVMRQHRGEASAASHLCLLVKPAGSKTKYLVDVGFGGSMVKPIPLKEAEYDQPPFTLGLEKLDGGYWRFWEDVGNGKFSYDFLEEPARESSLAEKCTFLQNDPSSNFVMNMAVQRRRLDQHCALRGRVFTVNTPTETKSKTVETAEELVALLASKFGLDVPEVAGLWPRIAARHEELFGLEIRRLRNVDDLGVAELVAKSDEYLSALYPPESNHAESLEALVSEHSAFFVGYLRGEVAACGAAKTSDDYGCYGEIKRVFVAEQHRGKQFATAIMVHLESYLKSENIRIVRLEAGPKQPEALNFYRKLGYVERGPFGSYVADPLSVFMEKVLTD